MPTIRFRFFPLLLVLLTFLESSSFASGQEISARYRQPRGTQISWTISVPSPPPAAVIVSQSIPPGTLIKDSLPPHNSYDPATGIAKWLITDVKAGRMEMSMELDTPIRKKGEIHGKIIFQDQSAKPYAEGFILMKNRKTAIEGC